VFVGRLSAEKGVETLLEAWRHLGGSVPLKLVGDGPMAATVREAAAKDAAIRWLGNMPLDAIYGVLGAAKLLVLPSQCYETFARVAIEAFAKGTPVIGSRLGAMVEIVDEDAIDLAEKVRRVLADPLELARMRQAARQKFDRYFTADVNHKSLMAIYERVFGDRPGPELRS
jgi:glycosyltransferase involved in cell wall biosynthesis